MAILDIFVYSLYGQPTSKQASKRLSPSTPRKSRSGCLFETTDASFGDQTRSDLIRTSPRLVKMQLQRQINHYVGLSDSHSTVATPMSLGTRFCTLPVHVAAVHRLRPRPGTSENCGRVHASLGNSPCADFAKLHAFLGVGPEASKSEIKRAYRRLALKYHPDVCSSNDGHVRFLHIKSAYDSIMNPKPSDFAPSSYPTTANAYRPGSYWCGEAGPDDVFSEPYNTSEEAPGSYDPWWDVLQNSMSRNPYEYVQSESDLPHEQRGCRTFSQRSISISWEDW
ncbi:hypothetical protein Mapa_018667 [Marchantia paleacea]|nr:hypothetical protein Mapa_018667 [Marchantia paleacea]